MKRTHIHTICTSLSLLFIVFYPFFSTGQPAGCQLKDPIVAIDFGIGKNIRDFNATEHENYHRVNDDCPEDGFYSYTNYTSNCFNNDWFTIVGDHTGNNGNIMLVNAALTGGRFFSYELKGLKENSMYEFAVWLTNMCRIDGFCSPLPPNIQITISTQSGKKIAGIVTGQLTQTAIPMWRKYAAYFTTPSGESDLMLTMTDLTLGGCGNDFAMDDITIRECVPQMIVTKNPAKVDSPQSKVIIPATAKPLPKKAYSEKNTIRKTITQANRTAKDTPVIISTRPALSRPVPSLPASRAAVNVPVPAILVKRENPVVKTLTTSAGEMTIDLYDNGQVDGDTVTIYHNNELLISRAGLSENPISFKITVDEKQPRHELVMVANNLGSIPPNTSLMIIRINGKRYDVFISSSEQKNAKLVIELETAAKH